MISIQTSYTETNRVLENGRGVLPLGHDGGEFLPYELLFGALSACFYSNLAEILRKKKIHPERVAIRVEGEKRQQVPALLEWVKLSIDVYGVLDREAVEKSVDLAAKYCSIHETISRVARMERDVIFHE